MRGFISFAISFAMLIFLWYYHFLFFRRYGLQTQFILVLNSILLFVMLFYIYPLKFLFNFLVYILWRETTTLEQITITVEQSANLMVIYSSGLLIIFIIYMLMYFYAYRHHAYLKLTESEILLTKSAYEAHCIYASVSVLSILFALYTDMVAMSGFIYAFFGPARAVHGVFIRKRLDKIKT